MHLDRYLSHFFVTFCAFQGYYLGAVHKCQHFHKCTNRTLSETPSPYKRVHINNFLSGNNPHENNKNQTKKLKVYRKNVAFSQTH